MKIIQEEIKSNGYEAITISDTKYSTLKKSFLDWLNKEENCNIKIVSIIPLNAMGHTRSLFVLYEKDIHKSQKEVRVR